MTLSTDDIYTAFGKIVNSKENQRVFYKNYDRELIFYRCNESEVRDNIDRLDALHGTFCITGSNEILRLSNDDLLECGKAIEKYCQISELNISINIYSDNDEAITIMNYLSLFLQAQSVRDNFRALGVYVDTFKDRNIRRLDEVVKGRYEYRSQMDIVVRATTADIQIPLDVWTKWGYSINGHPNNDYYSCGGTSDSFDRLDVDCKS